MNPYREGYQCVSPRCAFAEEQRRDLDIMLEEVCRTLEYEHPTAFWSLSSNLSSDTIKWWSARKSQLAVIPPSPVHRKDSPLVVAAESLTRMIRGWRR